MQYHYKEARVRFRKGAAVALEELSDKRKKKELVTELAMISGYVGFIDIEDYGVRVYVFTNDESAQAMVKEARKIGFRTAGEVEESLALKNTELQRPHLQYIPKDSFLRELYK